MYQYWHDHNVLTHLSPVKEIQRCQPQHQHLHTRPSHRRARLPSSLLWCPGELSGTLWAWRSVRKPHVTPCSTSASTWPSVTWMKPSSPSSSSRGTVLYVHDIIACGNSAVCAKRGHMQGDLPTVGTVLCLMSSHPWTSLSTGALDQSQALLLHPWLFSESSEMVCSGRAVTKCFLLVLRMSHCCHLPFFTPHVTHYLN